MKKNNQKNEKKNVAKKKKGRKKNEDLKKTLKNNLKKSNPAAALPLSRIPALPLSKFLPLSNIPALPLSDIPTLSVLCRLRSIAVHRDHFVRRLSVRPSVYVSACPILS